MAGAVPTPPVATIGEQITASFWNTSATAPDTFQQNPPVCEVYNATGLSVPNTGVETSIPWDTEVTDSDNMHSTSVNTTRITFNTPGRYNVFLFISLPGATYTLYQVRAMANGASIRTWDFSSPGGAAYQQTVAFSRVFAVGDYYELQVAQTSGAARTTNTSGLYCTGTQVIHTGSLI